MTPLSLAATCRGERKRRHVAALQKAFAGETPAPLKTEISPVHGIE
jgi:hypothetical protein